MTPTRQSILGDDGDCFRAAVATVCDISLEDVPHFYAPGADTNALMASFTRRFDIGVAWVVPADFAGRCIPEKLWPEYWRTPLDLVSFADYDGFWVASGPSRASEKLGHAVVYHGNSFIWNPYPGCEEDDLDWVVDACLMVKGRPASWVLGRIAALELGKVYDDQA